MKLTMKLVQGRITAKLLRLDVMIGSESMPRGTRPVHLNKNAQFKLLFALIQHIH